MSNLALKYRLNPLFWLYYRKYKKALLANPLSPESIEMAQRSGSVRKLWKLAAASPPQKPLTNKRRSK